MFWKTKSHWPFHKAKGAPHHMEHTEYLVARSTTDNMEIGEQTQAARDTRDISRFALGGQLMNPHAVPLITP